MAKTTNIKCINVVGFSDVGKTTVLRRLALLINDNTTWLSDSVLLSNKYKFAVILEGDTVPIIKRHFCILKREKIDYILCTSHTGDTLEHIYSELVNLGLFKNNIDAKNSTLLVFKESVIFVS